ncbi:MAG: hypothetical protein ACOCQC_02185 [Halanaerobiaceae bacterium]
MVEFSDPEVVFYKIIKFTLLVSFFPAVSVLTGGDIASFRGFVFGLVLSILLLRLKLVNIRRSLDLEEEKASTFIRNRYFVEYFICFLALLLSRNSSSLNYLAAAAGLLMVKLTVIGWMIIDFARDRMKEKLAVYKNYQNTMRKEEQ